MDEGKFTKEEEEIGQEVRKFLRNMNFSAMKSKDCKCEENWVMNNIKMYRGTC